MTLAPAAPFTTAVEVAVAIVVPLFRMVNVTVPPLTVPAELVTVAVRGTDWATVL